MAPRNSRWRCDVIHSVMSTCHYGNQVRSSEDTDFSPSAPFECVTGSVMINLSAELMIYEQSTYLGQGGGPWLSGE